MTSLHDIAPRIARARDMFIAHQERVAAWRRSHAHRVFRAENLVLHRELQLIRAGATGSRSYLRKRQGKLDAAEHALTCIRAEQPPALGSDQ